MLARIFKGATIALFLSAGCSAQAHHSFASADQTRQITVTGTLKEFSFTAPHASVIVIGPSENGAAIEYKVATVAPTALIKQGFKSKDFVVGDQVVVIYYPNRNGAPGGILHSLKLSDGRVLKGNVF